MKAQLAGGHVDIKDMRDDDDDDNISPEGKMFFLRVCERSIMHLGFKLLCLQNLILQFNSRIGKNEEGMVGGYEG